MLRLKLLKELKIMDHIMKIGIQKIMYLAYVAMKKNTTFENVLKIMNNCNEKFGSSSSGICGILKLEERLKKN